MRLNHAIEHTLPVQTVETQRETCTYEKGLPVSAIDEDEGVACRADAPMHHDRVEAGPGPAAPARPAQDTTAGHHRGRCHPAPTPPEAASRAAPSATR